MVEVLELALCLLTFILIIRKMPHLALNFLEPSGQRFRSHEYYRRCLTWVYPLQGFILRCEPCPRLGNPEARNPMHVISKPALHLGTVRYFPDSALKPELLDQLKSFTATRLKTT